MIAQATNYAKSRAKAEEVLAENFITEPPVPIFSMVRKYGIGLSQAPMNYQYVAGFIDIETTEIVVNLADTPDTQAFIAAYELGVWLLYKQDIKNKPNLGILVRHPFGSKDTDALIQEADAFAAYLTVPSKLFQKYKEEDDGRLSRIFGVPEEVIGYRRWLEEQQGG